MVYDSTWTGKFRFKNSIISIKRYEHYKLSRGVFYDFYPYVYITDTIPIKNIFKVFYPHHPVQFLLDLLSWSRMCMQCHMNEYILVPSNGLFHPQVRK